MTFRLVTCALLMIIGAAAGASAQESAGAVYATVGVSFPQQSAQRAPSPPPFAAPGGGTVSWLFGGGVFLSRAISAEFDVSATAVMTSAQIGRHDTSESGWRQDRFASFGVKFHIPVRPALRVEPTAGLVLIHTKESSSPSLPVDQRPPWSREASRLGPMVGADLRFGWRFVAFLPGIRIYVSGQPESTTWEYNYPGWTIRPSLAITAGF